MPWVYLFDFFCNVLVCNIYFIWLFNIIQLSVFKNNWLKFIINPTLKYKGITLYILHFYYGIVFKTITITAVLYKKIDWDSFLNNLFVNVLKFYLFISTRCLCLLLQYYKILRIFYDNIWTCVHTERPRSI